MTSAATEPRHDSWRKPGSAAGSPPILIGSLRPPLRVGLIGASDLVAQGLSVILGAHERRVLLLDLSSRSAQDVDLVLLDVSLDHPAGFARLRDLLLAGFRSVLVLGWDLTPSQQHQFLVAGASGYLSLRLDVPDLLSALEEMHDQRVWHRGRSAVRYAGPGPGARLSPASHGELVTAGCSPRELQVLRLVCRGRTNLEIAEELFLSINTVKTYIRGAYRKIGVTRRTQVVVWGIQHGL